MSKHGAAPLSGIVTLRDVAQAANVSISTASRALAGTGLVNRRTESRVVRTAENLGYTPNSLARGLATRSSRLIGLILHNLVNASFQQIAEIAQQRLLASNYQMVLCVTKDDPKIEEQYLQMLFEHRVDGLLITPTGENASILARYKASGREVVTLVRRHGGCDLDAVLLDDVEGAYRGTQHLLSLGHERIGLIVGREETTSGRERLSGYLRALREGGIDPRPTYIHQVPYRADEGSRACMELLDAPDPPTAIFAANHEASFGVLQVLSERDISIPSQMSLLCYEDAPWFKLQKPGISVVLNGADAMADLAVDMLLGRLARGRDRSVSLPEGKQELRVGSNLMLRNSTHRPRG